MPKSRLALVAALLALAAGLAACSDDQSGTLVIYSGRSENLVGPLLERFEKDTGTDISVRYAETSELAPTLLEEGSATRADVFLSQDAGALAALARAGLLGTLPAAELDVVEPRFRDPDGRWVGVTARARVIAYNTERVRPDQLPQSVFDVTGPAWKDRVGFPPTNASFVAFVSALVEKEGTERARAFLDGLKANGAKRYDNNILTLDAVARGEVDLGLVNHYYLYGEFKERPDAPVANHYPGQQPGGEGTFINVSGAAILRTTDQRAAAERLVKYLLAEDAQHYFRDETTEYPLRAGIDAIDELPALDSLRTIDVPLHSLGKDLEASLALIKEVGLT